MISFSCPSRGRPDLAKRLVDTATATQKHKTEFLFYLNDDDEILEEYKDLLDEKHYTNWFRECPYTYRIIACKSGIYNKTSMEQENNKS